MKLEGYVPETMLNGALPPLVSSTVNHSKLQALPILIYLVFMCMPYCCIFLSDDVPCFEDHWFLDISIALPLYMSHSLICCYSWKSNFDLFDNSWLIDPNQSRNHAKTICLVYPPVSTPWKVSSMFQVSTISSSLGVAAIYIKCDAILINLW